jgi:hypothetical protein
MFNIETYVELTKAMKSADTTAENKATPWARATLAGLLNTDLTVATMTSALIAAYKPRTSTGKLAATMGALPASPRGRANTMKYIMDNIGVPGVRDVVDVFVSGTKGSIAELHRDVKAAIKAQGEKLAGEPPVNEEEEEAEPQLHDVQPVRSVGDNLKGIADYIRSMTGDDVAAFHAELSDIIAAVSEASRKLTEEPEAIAA